ncbi:neuronal acetylcholine receptor subunit alpha-10-like [Patiria miniata]|uniref:Uncharacterized protein n=1 Tax=Patiria miniata TaxID=46514 RepID=A0A914BA75_PATMI|nr:neuronal acetylcholine receptor subunit alpha-10-like [Patiria miniata]
MSVVFIFIVMLSRLLVTAGNDTVVERSAQVRKISQEQRLVADLFQNYSSIIRPVMNQNETLIVTCDAALQTIADFNQKKQYIQTNMWLRLKWKDFNLQWNPDDYGGVSSITVPLDLIWRPDLHLHRNRNKDTSGISSISPRLTSSGVVYWNTPANIMSPCRYDASYFPFDEQHCQLTFSSWSYNYDAVHLRVSNSIADISNYQDNGIWDLLGMLQVVNTTYYTCCPKPFSVYIVTIVVRHRPLFYLSNLLIPCCLIVAITMCSFLLAVDSGEKISLVVTNLLSLVVFMNNLSKAIPNSSDGIPLMIQYIAVTIAIVTISMLATVCVLRIHYRPSLAKPVPAWLKKVAFVYLPPILILRVPAYKMTPATPAIGEPLREMPSSSDAGSDGGTTLANFVSINRRLRCLTARCKRQDAAREIVAEWKQVARVIDRMLFVVFLVVTVSLTMGILMQSKPQTSPEQIEIWQQPRD